MMGSRNMAKGKAKRNNPEWSVDSIHFDKGKRHYWNSLKKDYGVYESVDRWDQPKSYQYEAGHRRRHSTIAAYTDSQQHQPSAIERSSSNRDLQSTVNPRSHKPSPKLDLISNNIEIKLPAIARPQPQQQPQQQSSEKQIQTVRKYELVQARPQRRLHQQRVKTENVTIGYSERGRKIRYSPTYVCSFNNPLPTFKLFDQGDRKAVYQYGYGQERS